MDFQEWFEKLFLPAVEDRTKTGPVILFLDGHNSHTALELAYWQSNGKENYNPLPATTHYTPLDLAVFGPLKSV